MKLLKALSPLTAAAMAATLLATPAVQAEVSASVGIANMYLWRGQNEPNPPPGAGGSRSQVSGELKWTKDNIYYGTWVSSSGIGGSETDLFVGMTGNSGNISYDISYWNYLYPESAPVGGPTNDGLMDTNNAEIVASANQGPFSAAFHLNVDSDTPDDNYLTLGYAWDKYTATFGMWMKEISGANEYSHITVTYAATDALSFSVSKAFDDSATGAPDAVEEDPLVQVAYGWNFDLKK
jgi:uncharacterized protein (TIGR02001 family)